MNTLEGTNGLIGGLGVSGNVIFQFNSLLLIGEHLKATEHSSADFSLLSLATLNMEYLIIIIIIISK